MIYNTVRRISTVFKCTRYSGSDREAVMGHASRTRVAMISRLQIGNSLAKRIPSTVQVVRSIEAKRSLRFRNSRFFTYIVCEPPFCSNSIPLSSQMQPATYYNHLTSQVLNNTGSICHGRLKMLARVREDGPKRQHRSRSCEKQRVWSFCTGIVQPMDGNP